MGNQLCCFSIRGDTEDNPLMEEDALGSNGFETQEDEFVQIDIGNSIFNLQEVPLTEQKSQHHNQQGNIQIPKHIDSHSEVEDLTESENTDAKLNGIYEFGNQLDSNLDGSTDDTISALEENFVINQPEYSTEEEIYNRNKDRGNHQHQRRFSTQISLQAETLKVTGAGNAAANGVYRWFAAHGRFVMFTNQAQFQIVGGVNLSEYGERYYDSWVIEEIKENIVSLYAVASGEYPSINSDGWICIDGALPAPKLEPEEEQEFYEEEDSYMDIVEKSISISPIPTSCSQKLLIVNSRDGIKT